MLDTGNKTKIKRLKDILEEVSYDTILKGLRREQYFLDPWAPFNEMEDAIRLLDKGLGAIFELFLLGKTISRNSLPSIIQDKDIHNLKEIGLILEEGTSIKTMGYVIIPYLGRYFVLNPPTHYPTSHQKIPIVYMGRDSYRLAQNLVEGEASSGKTILDLCTGSGIQAILGANNCKKAIGVEINHEAARVARFNCILNDIDEKVTILEGDLYGPVMTEKFDIIYANPPFVPVPPGVIYSMYGDGGIDGLKIIKVLLDGLDEHLKEGGQSVIVGDAIGDDQNPFFVTQLERLTQEKKWNTKVILYGGPHEHLLLPIYLHRLAAHAVIPGSFDRKDLVSSWMRSYEEMGAEYFYTFTIKISKRRTASPNIEIIRLYNPWRKKDRPVLHKDIKIKPYLYGAKVYKGETFLLNVADETYNILKRCDGKTDLDEIIKTIFRLNPLAYKDLGIAGAANSVLDSCYKLQQKGIIFRG